MSDFFYQCPVFKRGFGRFCIRQPFGHICKVFNYKLCLISERRFVSLWFMYVIHMWTDDWHLVPKPARIALRMLRCPCPFWLKHGRSERIFSEGCLGFQSFKIMQHECFLIKELEAIIVLHATKSNIKKEENCWMCQPAFMFYEQTM